MGKGKCLGKKCGSCTEMGYMLAVIGAAIYYISMATGFWVGVLGVIKALIWPLFVVYGLLKFLGV